MVQPSRMVAMPPLSFCLVAILTFSSIAIQSCYAACNITAGSWVRAKSALYSASKVPSFGRDCSARKDKTYLQWQWVVPGCTISRVDQNPEGFLKALSNRKLMFVGDSIAKNIYSALFWALPRSLIASPDDRSFISPKYKVTVSRVWSPYFTKPTKGGGEKIVNLDQVDPEWASSLKSTSYLVIVGFRHFFHDGSRFYRKGKLLKNYAQLDAVRDVSVLLRDYIKQQQYKGTVFVLTYPPSHSDCKKFSVPYSTKQIATGYRPSVSNVIRSVFGNAGSPFKLIDITYLSAWRPDAHPGSGSSGDCAHWCVPGVPNTWMDIVYSMITNSIDS